MTERPTVTVAVVMERDFQPNRWEDWRHRIAEVLPATDAKRSADSQRGFLITAEGEDRCEVSGQVDRRITAGEAQHQLAPERHPHDGIVHGARDGAVVKQKEVRDAAEPMKGFVVVGAKRLA